MSVYVLIISHGELGHALVETLKKTYGREELPLSVSVIDILNFSNTELMVTKLRQHAKEVDKGDGVLILTDVFGATPTNIAQEIQNDKIRIVTGLNLPMLLRVMNDATLSHDRDGNISLETLARNAMESGQAGIIECVGTDAK